MKNLHNDARNRILSIAAQHFALCGFHGSSVREITKDAQVNLAAVNYHFRNKESLYCEVLSSSLRPLNEARIAKLENAAARAGGAPIPLSIVIEIFAEPLFELCRNPSQSNSFLARLIGRSITEPLPFIQAFLTKNQHAFTKRFVQAIRPHAPKMSASEFMWRLSFVIGAFHHTLATMHYMNDLTRGLCQNNDIEQAKAQFVQFAVNTIQEAATGR